jgi:hypothetical protein
VSKQLRGDMLVCRIKKVIEDLSAEASDNGRPFVYNASKIAKLIPVSRTTLRRYDSIVSSTLQSLKAGRRSSSGEVRSANDRAEVERLRRRLKELERELTALQRHHVAIYRQFQLYSVDVTPMIRPIIETECSEAGHCTFCGSEWREGAAANGNVLQLKGKRGLSIREIG